MLLREVFFIRVPKVDAGGMAGGGGHVAVAAQQRATDVCKFNEPPPPFRYIAAKNITEIRLFRLP